RYNHNPDSFHVHLIDASAIQITYFFQIVKERQPISVDITLTGSIANEKDSNQTSFEYLSLKIIESGRHYNRLNR
ncbi:hypothetical protein, partial [Burkholderia ambifaria]|uniref:hypothetical protein n=1 Tax=Burkholderia ambifaria TaxID=152480 RepID=UPI001ABAC7B2